MIIKPFGRRLVAILTSLTQTPVLSSWSSLNFSDVAKLDLYAIMVPKAGSTTLGIAAKIIRCYNGKSSVGFTGSLPCKAFCNAYLEGIRKNESVWGSSGRKPLSFTWGACSPTGGHDPRFQFCHRGIYGLDSILSSTVNWGRELFGGGRQGHLCVAMLRNPWTRAVSGWLYSHHSPSGMPGDVGFGVQWPPSQKERRRLKFIKNAPADEHLWINDSSRQVHRVAFDEYITSAAYSNVQTRMFGENALAYNASVHVSVQTLERAVAILKRVPFGIMEEVSASYLLFAHVFSTTHETCLMLVEVLKGIVASGSRRHKLKFSSSSRPRKFEPSYEKKAESIIRNKTHYTAFLSANEFDVALYASAQIIWCDQWRSALRATSARSCVAAVAREQIGLSRIPPLCIGLGT